VARVVVEKARASAVAKIVRDGLIGHNRPFAGPIRYRRLVLSAREGRRIVGGLVGDCAWNFVYVHLLWVDEAARGKDHGSRLMREAERVAALNNTPASGTTRFFYVKKLSGARA
jgi:GNAT superfamily N-acetyltransferase